MGEKWERRIFVLPKRLYKTEPSCEFHTVEIIFTQRFEKVIANTMPGFVLVYCEYVEDQTNLKLVLPKERPVLVSANAQS